MVRRPAMSDGKVRSLGARNLRRDGRNIKGGESVWERSTRVGRRRTGTSGASAGSARMGSCRRGCCCQEPCTTRHTSERRIGPAARVPPRETGTRVGRRRTAPSAASAGSARTGWCRRGWCWRDPCTTRHTSERRVGPAARVPPRETDTRRAAAHSVVSCVSWPSADGMVPERALLKTDLHDAPHERARRGTVHGASTFIGDAHYAAGKGPVAERCAVGAV